MQGVPGKDWPNHVKSSSSSPSLRLCQQNYITILTAVRDGRARRLCCDHGSLNRHVVNVSDNFLVHAALF